MEDLISRQAALDALYHAYEYNGRSVQAIRNLPSAERRGRWIIKGDLETEWYRITCSECGEDVTSTAPCIGFFPNAKVIWDYCPYCGARMNLEDEAEE